MKPYLRRAAWALVVLVLLGVVVWTAANLIGSSRYQSAVRDLEADGFSLQLPRMAPPEVPAAENAAPYYSAAFALVVPAPDDAEWINSPQKTLAELGPQQRAAAEAWLKQNGEALDMARRAQKRPRCRFERDYSQGFSMLMPEITGTMSLSRVLFTLAESQVLAADGAGARESVKLLFSLAGCFRDDPVLVSQLVRICVLESALALIPDAVTEATTEAELREWQALLPPEAPLQGSLEGAYRGEIAMAAMLLDNPTSEAFMPAMNARDRVKWDLSRPLVRLDGADYLRDMRRIILACRKPYLEAAMEIDALRLHRFDPIWSPIRSRLMPAMDRYLLRQATVDARLTVARAGLEAERVRKATGSYPKSVAGTDPFSGKPLVYDVEKGRIASVRATEGPEDKPTEWRLRAKK
jgi:hypothetical protein